MVPSNTTFYFGSCYTAAQLAATGFKGHAMSQGGRPMPWSDNYAARLAASGRYVERTRYVTVAHQNPAFDGETVNVWQVVETIAPVLA